MPFNSLSFAVFFIVVYSLYLVLRHKWQNRMLLAASCFFYAAWDWRFLFLMFASISVDYYCALRIQSTDDKRVRKQFFLLSIFVNLSVLGFFKYYNFFAQSLHAVLSHCGIQVPLYAINIILPLGISFYTFEAISYVFDVYRKKMEPIRHYFEYALFVTYFPHLIAGPILRAKDILPQIMLPRRITAVQVCEGAYLITWGLFLKVCIADNLARIVDPAFAAGPPYNGAGVLVAVYAFAFQIYADFDAYSNMARGFGRLMGFDIMMNFNLPYFSVNPREFWQRWHISLSTWLRDYLYVPLGGNRNGPLLTYRNLLITMFLGGLWHGASWTYVIWGIYQGVLLVIHRALAPLLAKLPKFWYFIRIIFFFHLICFGWLLFRVQSLEQASQMLHGLLDIDGWDRSKLLSGITGLWMVWCLLSIQVVQFLKNDILIILKQHWFIQGVFYFLIVFLTIVFGAGGGKEFIYFQF